MADTIKATLRRLPNTRDLRAEMLSLAARVAEGSLQGRLTVIDPLISEAKVRDEWQRLLPAFQPSVRERLTLNIESASDDRRETHFRAEQHTLPLERPNYRYEVLRLLVGASLEDDGPQPVRGLIDHIGASQTPIRQALSELKKAGLARSWSGRVELDAEDVSMELLARLGALPQTFRFRFQRGSRIKPPAALFQRVLPLLRPGSPEGWEHIALSGTPVAQSDIPDLDLAGIPRLDLAAHVPRGAKTFDAGLLRLLDDGLELEPSVVVPAAVVVTLVRADSFFPRDAGFQGVRCASQVDVFLSLLDAGLRDQALQYAKAVRP